MSKHQVPRQRRVRGLLASIAAVSLGFTGLVALATSSSADSHPGSSPANPIVLASPALAPQGAVTDGPYVNQCAREQRWVLTGTHPEYRYLREVPPVQQGAHLEYRWSIEQRTYTPAVQEQSHQVYSYKKTVQDFKTQWLFAKFTHTKTMPKNGAWSAYGPWTEWSPRQHTSWEDTNVEALGSPAFHGSGSTGTGHNKVEWYREWQARNTGETRTVPNGSHLEYSGERTTTLGGPWVLLPGYPKTVIDVAAVPASFGPWTFKEYTPWQLTDTPPADPDGDSDPNSPGNLLRIQDSSQETREVITSEAEAGYTEYYVLSGTHSLVAANASWLTADQNPGEGWTQFDMRTVTDGVTHYLWSDGVLCTSEIPVIPTVVTPTVVTPAALAETGFPLLGVLALAGSFSLLGGGLISARRLLRKSN